MRIPVGVILLMAAVQSVFALDAADRLAEAAVSHSSELKALKAEVAIAEAGRRQAGQWKNPEATVEAGFRRVSDSENVLQGNGFTAGISVVQPFDFPGKATLRKAIAGGRVEMAKIGLDQFRRALAGEIRSLAVRRAAAEEKLRLIGEIAGREADVIALVKQRPDTGPAVFLEGKLISARHLELRKLQAEAEAEREETGVELSSLSGMRNLPGLELTAPTRALDLKKEMFRAQAGNLQLKMHAVEMGGAKQEFALERLEAWPDVSFGPFFSVDQAGDTEVNAGAMASFELPAWDRNSAGIESARAMRDRQEFRGGDARRRLDAAVTRQCRTYALSQKLLGEISAESVSSFSEAADLADRQYRLGAISAQLYVDMQREHLNAALMRIEAIVRARLALLELDLLAGGQAP